MHDDLVERLLRSHSLVSDQVDKAELKVILKHLARQIAGYPYGSVVEMGCYVGTTSLFIRRVMDQMNAKGDFHVYDSFEGLPAKTVQDLSPAGEQFVAGELSASRKAFSLHFKKACLRAPIIHKGWFSELEPSAVPKNIVYAYLDGDYYESIKDSLRLIWPNLTSEAVVIIDDYTNEALPGAAKAVNEWVKAHQVRIRAEASLAILNKS